MTIEELKQLKKSGKFHHATYCKIGTVSEGLYIYGKELGEFPLIASFNTRELGKDAIDAAWDVVCDFGVSVGSFDEG